jgi:hypothetical protein
VGRLVRWATAEQGNWGLRQHAASRNDAEMWLKLDRQRQHQSSWRWWVVGTAAVLAAVAGLVLAYGPVPQPARLAVRDAALVLAACEELDDLIHALRSDRLNEDAAARLRTWLDRTRHAFVAAHQRLTLALS